MAGSLIGGRYAPLEVLGEGTFSEVHRVRDHETGRELALKLLRSSDPARTETLTRELALCARLDHPHIVSVVDTGLHADGRPFAVFELIPGHSLADRQARGEPIALHDTLRWMTQILDALVHVHDQGVIHRDLKPENILLHPGGARPHAMLTDFGIGGLVGDAGTEREHGTVAYAAPEQLRSEPMTPATDLYSWALVMLECLTGRRARRGATVQEVAFHALGASEGLVPPSLEEHPLGRLLRRLLDEDPRRRPGSAEQVLLELTRGTCATQEAQRALERWHREQSGIGGSDERGWAPPIRRRWCTVLVVDPGRPEPADGLASSRARFLQHVRAHGGLVRNDELPPFMACFGWLRASASPSADAATAALELAAALERHGAAGWRVGVCSGAIEADLHGSPTPGPTTDRVGELLRDAPARAVVTDELTATALAEDFELERASSHPRVLRRREPWELDELTPIEDATEAPAIYARVTDRLEAQWHQARGGVGAAISLTGPSDAGRPAILGSLRQCVIDSGGDWLSVRGDHHGPPSALCRMMGRRAGRSRDALQTFVGTLGLDPTETIPLLERLVGLRSGPPDIGLAVDLVFELAAARPLCVAIEHVDRADDELRDFVARLVDEVDGAPILLVLGAQDDFVPPWGRAKTDVIPLEPLEPHDVRAIAMRGGLDPSADELDELCHLGAGRLGLVTELVRFSRHPWARHLPPLGRDGRWRVSPRRYERLSVDPRCEPCSGSESAPQSPNDALSYLVRWSRAAIVRD